MEESKMNESKFYRCERCGNIVGLIENGGGQLVCCGQKMTKLEAGVVEASREKHIPVAEVSQGAVKVTVGSVLHPMSEEHSIEWIYLETNKGGQRRGLKPGEAPEAVFALADGEVAVAAYAWCNLHGLWKVEL